MKAVMYTRILYLMLGSEKPFRCLTLPVNLRSNSYFRIQHPHIKLWIQLKTNTYPGFRVTREKLSNLIAQVVEPGPFDCRKGIWVHSGMMQTEKIEYPKPLYD
ncbi:hypothetical protein B296_00014452 [Ensete ventricosum]|uniref:Uncharacterized protein n=1 Tax=Ensete ventricosum TaxID=4639 RepID=A0A426ZVT9_ENSVE|nr:hypothetical protein B296_00014452 [Ensete ventricosum]